MSKLSDEELLSKNAHIPNDEIQQDVFATKNEVNMLLSAKAKDLAISGGRLAAGYSLKIREREDFIKDLERILELRATHAPKGKQS